jgi:hypothetical protein
VTELTPATGAGIRIFRTYDGTGTGAELGVHRSVEHFTGVSARGGRFGSAAFANLPCDTTPDVAPQRRTGWGAALLIGGDASPNSRLDREMSCEANDVASLGTATGPTTWTVRGEALGGTESLNRLTVFDFPRP